MINHAKGVYERGKYDALFSALVSYMDISGYPRRLLRSLRARLIEARNAQVADGSPSVWVPEGWRNLGLGYEHPEPKPHPIWTADKAPHRA